MDCVNIIRRLGSSLGRNLSALLKGPTPATKASSSTGSAQNLSPIDDKETAVEQNRAVSARNGVSLPMTRPQALASIRGQVVLVPDLLKQYPEWPLITNPHVEMMKAELHDWIEMVCGENHKKAAILNSCLFAEFVSMCQPVCNYEGLKASVYLNMWLFLWDDWFEKSFGSAGVVETQAHLAETVNYLSACLLADDPDQVEVSADILLAEFKLKVSDPLFTMCDTSRRAIFLKELLLYIKGVEMEQYTHSQDTVTSVEGYWTYRRVSGAVRVCLAINEPTNNLKLPLKVMVDPDMSNLWDATTRHVAFANDLYSCKKEIDQGILALLGLLYANTANLQLAVDEVVAEIYRGGDELEESAAKLRAKYIHEPEILPDLEIFIDTCKYFCTANVSWSLVSERYQMASMKKLKGGGIEMVM